MFLLGLNALILGVCMSEDIFPSSYESWKQCITEKGGLSLDKKYVDDRIKNLSNTNSREHKEFVKLYGIQWTETVLGYFKQAQREL